MRFSTPSASTFLTATTFVTIALFSPLSLASANSEAIQAGQSFRADLAPLLTTDQKITISCAGGAAPGAGTLSGSAQVQVTYYQGQAHTGDVQLFERINQFNGEFTFTVTTDGNTTTETAPVTGGFSEIKYQAHGMPMHLTGVSTAGRVLELNGDEYYGNSGLPYTVVHWGDFELSHNCQFQYQ